MRLARYLSRHNPTCAEGLDWASFNYGSQLTQGPNCYSYAMGEPGERLMPGWLAATRGHPQARGPGNTTAERLAMFELDGLTRLTHAHSREIPTFDWIVSLHQRDLDFHLRRLDASGWSEKRGDHDVTSFRVRHWSDLLRARSEEGPYTFSGFYLVGTQRLRA
jgi:hypothetical protein